MILTTTLMLLALAAAILFLLVARKPRTPVQNIADLMARSTPVDLESFRNLVDPDEEAYLRFNLRPAEFRRLQRRRMLAAAGYLRRTAYNAALVLQVADTARRSGDPQMSKSAAELAESALQLRIYSILAMCLFGVRLVVPSIPIRFSHLILQCDRLHGHMAGFIRIQSPSTVSQVEACL